MMSSSLRPYTSSPRSSSTSRSIFAEGPKISRAYLLEILERADLVTTQEIARRLGVRSSAVSNWAHRYPSSYPAPILGAHLEKNARYLWREIEEWFSARAHLPRPASLRDERLSRDLALPLPLERGGEMST